MRARADDDGEERTIADGGNADASSRGHSADRVASIDRSRRADATHRSAGAYTLYIFAPNAATGRPKHR
jgi:hypothetical protein